MKTFLYLGTDPTHFKASHPHDQIIHYSLIQIVPLKPSDLQDTYSQVHTYTHFIFTSKNAVSTFFFHLRDLQLSLPSEATVVAIGKVTASALEKQEVAPSFIAENETQEGVITLLQTLELKNAYLLIPKSSLSRPVLFSFLDQSNICYCALTVYETHFVKPDFVPNWEEIDCIVFTSPSTVRAFVKFFEKLPPAAQSECIGPITQAAFDRNSSFSSPPYIK